MEVKQLSVKQFYSISFYDESKKVLKAGVATPINLSPPPQSVSGIGNIKDDDLSDRIEIMQHFLCRLLKDALMAILLHLKSKHR